jgi:hypothetical protein
MTAYRSEKEFLRSLKRFNALSSKQYEWHTGYSEREHECLFGHTIPPEQLYFKKPLDMEGERKVRVCRDCMEKLVFLTIDSDRHSKQLSEHLYRERHPAQNKILKIMSR